MARTREHGYDITTRWTGNTGSGTEGYKAYGREVDVVAAGKPTMILGSADPAFLGDAERWNPEEMLVASLSACHMLSYLAACALRGVVVTSYEDTAHGSMAETGGSGQFTEVVLRPVVTVAEESMVAAATELHQAAHESCFIANSVNFPVRHEASVRSAGR
ncbi:OsmC family protein [Streptomyces hoynatensis]|uniref:OsmC family peroxiredoxin n=1 Tax=Streptomyces hoynatensis TaxID=1141874 RepID=A0A3A9YJQ3_9ACTN|nr:OsmC family protein [Streptomyces hoynatensis]RKN35164.1 OsmC family peroxiredoxin [Streptomyces hoynatensis]